MAALLKFEVTVSFLWFSLLVHSGSLKRIKYSKLYSLAHTRLSNVFSALKGTHFYVLLGFSVGKSENSGFFSETIEACDLIVGRYRHLIDFMKVCE